MTHGESSTADAPAAKEQPSGGDPPVQRASVLTSPVVDAQGFPIAETDRERAIVERLRSRRRGVYIVLALGPFAGCGLHLLYRRDISVGRALVLLLIGPFVWLFHGMPSGLYWLLDGGRSWNGMLALRATNELVACRTAELLVPERAEAQRQRSALREARTAEYLRHLEARNAEANRERGARLEKERRERAARIEAEQREQAIRDAALVPLYGGKPQFVQMVREKKIGLGMTRAAVEASWGAPADTREEISVKRHRVKLYYGREVGAKGKVSYRHEIELVNDRVTRIKDL